MVQQQTQNLERSREQQVRQALTFPKHNPRTALEARQIPKDQLGPVNKYMRELQTWNKKFSEVKKDRGVDKNLKKTITQEIAKAAGFTKENGFKPNSLRLSVVETENEKSGHPIALVSLKTKSGDTLLEFSVSRMHDFVAPQYLGDFKVKSNEQARGQRAPKEDDLSSLKLPKVSNIA